jgi:DNA modification methylase
MTRKTPRKGAPTVEGAERFSLTGGRALEIKTNARPVFMKRMTTWKLRTGDLLKQAAKLPPEHFHAILTDPPYSYGFMNMDWDKTGVSFSPETWQAVARTLKPGGFVMAFASSRGWHRLACALEDAGLEIHLTIFNWVQSQGFPKAASVYHPAFQGHRYGKQVKKPAVEPIIVAQKPFEGTAQASIVKHGAGALNVDAGRIDRGGERMGGGSVTDSEVQGWDRPWKHDSEAVKRRRKRAQASVKESEDKGGWPSNFTLQHQPECGAVCASHCAVAALDAQAGPLSSGKPSGVRKASNQRVYRLDQRNGTPVTGFGDSGTASRFYHVSDWAYEVLEQIDGANPVRYCAKAGRRERDAGLARLPKREMRRVNSGGLEKDPRWKPYTVRNDHRTVKPISLTYWLARLLLPPAAYAPLRLLTPFSGSGSELIGGLLAGFDEMVGIERSKHFNTIANARLDFWAKQGRALLAAGKLSAPAKLADALPLFEVVNE